MRQTLHNGTGSILVGRDTLHSDSSAARTKLKANENREDTFCNFLAGRRHAAYRCFAFLPAPLPTRIDPWNIHLSSDTGEYPLSLHRDPRPPREEPLHLLPASDATMSQRTVAMFLAHPEIGGLSLISHLVRFRSVDPRSISAAISSEVSVTASNCT